MNKPISTTSKTTTNPTMELEQLQQKYNALLSKYKVAVTNYITFLNDQAKQPCAKYSGDSKNIDQKCVDHLWKRSGCGTGDVHPDASKTDISSRSLNALIYVFYIWSTNPFDMFRKGCYGSSKNYNNSTQPDYKVNQPDMVAIPGYAFNGTSSIGIDKRAVTVQDCYASCAKLENCSGATFVSQKCMLKTGDSPIVPASDSYAIVSKEKQLLLDMELLNSELLAVNHKILLEVKKSETMYTKNTQISNVKNTKLIRRYDELMKERNEIADLLADYEYLGNAQVEQDTYKEYYSYWLWTIVLLILIWGGYRLLMNNPQTVQYGGDLRPSAYYVVGVLLVLVIILNRILLV